MQELLGSKGPWSTLKWKTKADSSCKGQKDFICREENAKAAWGRAADLEIGGPLNQVGNQVLYLYLLRKSGGFSLVRTDVSWEEVSPWLIVTFWDFLQSALQYPHPKFLFPIICYKH
jgi:hypothetical protein